MISDERRDQALTYLAETDESAARFKADHAKAKWKADSIFATIKAVADGTVAQKEGEAVNNPVYIEAKEHEFALFFEYEKIKNKRATEAILVDTWRSMNANRRQGGVT